MIYVAIGVLSAAVGYLWAALFAARRHADDMETIAQLKRDIDGYCPSCKWPEDCPDLTVCLACKHFRAHNDIDMYGWRGDRNG